MSLLTTKPVLIAPSAAAALTVTSGSTAWTYGNWVQFVTGLPVVAQIAGVYLFNGTWSHTSLDIDVGIGFPGAEVSLGSPIRIELNNSGTGCESSYMLPAPLSGFIPAGADISMRTRDSAGGSQVYSLALLYYLALDSDQATSYPAAAQPLAATHASVTPNGTAWLNSNWATVTAGITDAMYVFGLGFYPGVGGVDVEFDIGIGPGGAEVLQTTLRAGFGGQGERFTYVHLPALLKVAGSTRVAVRLRHSSTSVTPYTVALLYYDGPAATPPPSPAGDYPCNIKTPVFWGAISVAGSVFQFAKKSLNDPSTYYGGYKGPRLLQMGAVTRTASDWLTGAWQAQTATMKLADSDRYFRKLFTAGENPSFINGQAYFYLVSETTRVAQGSPALIFQGPIYDDPNTEHLQYTIQANDFVSVSYNLFQQDKQIPQRTIGTGDFPAAPSASLGLGVPIIGGIVSDEALGSPLGLVKLIDVGNLTVGGTTYAAALVAGHACAGGIINAYQNGAQITTWGTDAWAPGQTGWSTPQPSGALYFDINGNRYTLCFFTGTKATNFQNGTQPIYVNVQGMEPNADGTGTVIQDLLTLYKYLMVQWLTQSYQAGAWLSPSTFAFYPGGAATNQVVNTASWDAASTLSATYLAGGFLGAFVIGANGARQSIRNILQGANVSCNVMLCLNGQSQLTVSMLNESKSAFLGSARTITDRRDVLYTPMFSIKNNLPWFANDIVASYAQNYRGDSGGAWDATIEQGHAPSKGKYGLVQGTRQYPLIRDAATAGVVCQKQTFFGGADPPRIVTWAQSLCGMNFDVLTGVPITHYDGQGPNGWVGNPVWIISQTLDPATCTVTFTGVDVRGLVS